MTSSMIKNIMKKLLITTLCTLMLASGLQARNPQAQQQAEGAIQLATVKEFVIKSQDRSMWGKLAVDIQGKIDIEGIKQTILNTTVNSIFTFCSLSSILSFKTLAVKHKTLLSKMPYVLLKTLNQFTNQIFQQIMNHKDCLKTQDVQTIEGLRVCFDECHEYLEQQIKESPHICMVTELQSATSSLEPLQVITENDIFKKFLVFLEQSQLTTLREQVQRLQAEIPEKEISSVLSESNVAKTFNEAVKQVFSATLTTEDIHALVKIIQHPVIESLVKESKTLIACFYKHLAPMLQPVIDIAQNVACQELNISV